MADTTVNKFYDYPQKDFDLLLPHDSKLLREWDEKLLQAIGTSEAAYFEYGARSTKKLIPLHKTIAENVQASVENLAASPTDFKVQSLGYGNGKEASLPSDITARKNVDVVLSFKGLPILALSVKFPMTNIAQNKNNLKEVMRGEAYGLKVSNPNLVFSQFSIVNFRTPKYSAGKLKSIEYISEASFREYGEIEAPISLGGVRGEFALIDNSVVVFIDSSYADKMQDCMGQHPDSLKSHFLTLGDKPRIVTSNTIQSIHGYGKRADTFGPLLDKKSLPSRDTASAVWKALRNNLIPVKSS